MKLSFFVSELPPAQQSFHQIKKHHVQAEPEEADIIVAMGGDGFMLRTLHRALKLQKPVFGINCGSVGFLMNPQSPENLLERISKARSQKLLPLSMTAMDIKGKKHTSYAINEVSLFRRTALAAHVGISVNDICRMEKLVCDGVLVSTPAGSTAYNLSAHGPILPLESNLLALTPISAFRPRRWRGALLPHTSHIMLDVLDPKNRPLSAVADFHEVQDIASVTITPALEKPISLLFDPEENLENRILKEQFMSED